MSDTTDTKETQPVGNTKKYLRARFWVFTWNNYPEGYKAQLTATFKDAGATRYNFQPEKGASGTPHIQGFIGFQNPRSFDSMKKLIPGAHWEKCKSTKGEEYSMKSDTRDGELTKFGYREPICLIKEFYEWQKKILNIIDGPVDNRKIHWIYDEIGGKGKTFFCKHIILQRENEALYVSGKCADIKYGVSEFIGDDYYKLKILFIDIVRSYEQYVSYDGIESVKNGIFYNTKYESKQVKFNPPHVLIFANFMPDIPALSKDRWDILDISHM